jgi:hypothetical protein
MLANEPMWVRLPMEVRAGAGFAFETCRRATDRYSAEPFDREVVVIGSFNEISLSAQELAQLPIDAEGIVSESELDLSR